MTIKYQIQQPNVVHEIIDGESILFDLRSGIYYSIESTGVDILTLLLNLEYKDVFLKELRVKLKENDQAENMIGEIESFIQHLVTEDLLYCQEVEKSIDINLSDENAKLLTAISEQYRKPILNTYSDMKEMLLLDPIHILDVDERGWPKRLDEGEQKAE